MGVYEIYSPLLVDVSPKWVRHSPCMGEIVHPPAGVYSPTHRCLLPYPPVFTPPTRWCLLPLPAGVYFPHPPVFTSPTCRCLLPPPAGVYSPHAPVFTPPTRRCLLPPEGGGCFVSGYVRFLVRMMPV